MLNKIFPSKMCFILVLLHFNGALNLVHSLENGTDIFLSSNAVSDITNTANDVSSPLSTSNRISDVSQMPTTAIDTTKVVTDRLNSSNLSQISTTPNDMIKAVTSSWDTTTTSLISSSASDMASMAHNSDTTTEVSDVKFTNSLSSNAYNPETVTDVSNETTLFANDSINYLEGKHESLSSCPIFSLELPDYKIFPNGTVWIDAYSLLLNDSHYILINDILMYCVPFKGDTTVHKESVLKTTHLTLIGIGISMVSLFVHLIVFSIVPDLRNLPGWNLAALCSSLFMSYLLLFIISSGEAIKIPEMCTAIAFLTHFFMLASIVWMSIMSYDVFISLMRATGSFRISSTQFKWKKFGIYCSCAFGIALLFAFSSLLMEVSDIVPQSYRPDYKEMCWFGQRTPLLIFFAGPLIVLTCINFVFFGLSAYTIHFNKMKSDQDEQKSILKRRYLMYFRLSVIMGITWIVGIVAAIFNEDWLWYVFVLLNTLQGFFIFLAFTCCKKVKKFFREKILGERRGSQQTLSPTFQSYCFYANSIEKDLDKIVVSSEKDKTDTIVIQL